MATQLQDGNTPCLAATPSDPRPTVLVFDSGVGGLSVYDEIRRLLPDLHYIYAFDNVAFPYGEKCRTRTQGIQQAQKRLGQIFAVHIVVVACKLTLE